MEWYTGGYVEGCHCNYLRGMQRGVTPIRLSRGMPLQLRGYAEGVDCTEGCHSKGDMWRGYAEGCHSN